MRIGAIVNLIQGKRHGKVVDYAVSESRAMDVLEDICEHMKDYVVSQAGGGVEVVKASAIPNH